MLEGKTVKTIRLLTDEEMAKEMWEGRCVALVFDDGTLLYASQDSEGNGPGMLFGTDTTGKSFAF